MLAVKDRKYTTSKQRVDSPTADIFIANIPPPHQSNLLSKINVGTGLRLHVVVVHNTVYAVRIVYNCTNSNTGFPLQHNISQLLFEMS